MKHFNKAAEQLAKNGKTLQEEINQNPNLGGMLAYRFSSRIDILEKWISENTEHDGSKIGFASHEGKTKKSS